MVQKCTVYKKIRKCRRNLFLAKLQVLKWRHNHSQSPVFGLAVLYPTGSEIWRFWYIKTLARKIAIEKFVLLFLSVHCGNFIEQIKKICHIHFKQKLAFVEERIVVIHRGRCNNKVYNRLSHDVVTTGWEGRQSQSLVITRVLVLGSGRYTQFFMEYPPGQGVSLTMQRLD